MVDSTDPRDLAEGVDGPADAFQIGIVGMIIAGFGFLLTLGDAVVEGLSDIIGVMEAVRDFGIAFFENPALILEAGATSSSEALSEFGLEAFVLAVIIIAAAWWVWSYLDPDLPLIGRLIPWRR